MVDIKKLFFFILLLIPIFSIYYIWKKYPVLNLYHYILISIIITSFTTSNIYYYFNFIQTKTCPFCNDHGTCDSLTEQCKCDSGYSPPDCKNRDCSELNFCNKHGQCDILTGNCKCNPGFSPPDCKNRDCSELNFCNKHGQCDILTGNCICNPGYSQPDCKNRDCSELNFCNKHGKCDTLTGNCICESGYLEPDCKYQKSYTSYYVYVIFAIIIILCGIAYFYRKSSFIKIITDPDAIILKSRILANIPMIRINNKVYYLSSGRSMRDKGGPVVSLFTNTWMGAQGVTRDDSHLDDSVRLIIKRENILLFEDVYDHRVVFDNNVIKTLQTVIPDFNQENLNQFYEDLINVCRSKNSNAWDGKYRDTDSYVRRGVSSALGKIQISDLLLCGALSGDSEFFNKTIVGKIIREKGIEKYGKIIVIPDKNEYGNDIEINYPLEEDIYFSNLGDRLQNYTIHEKS